jgi:hypothetical protein
MRWTRQRRARWSSQGGSDRSASERSGAQDERRFNAFLQNFGRQHMAGRGDDGGRCVRRSRVVLASVADVKLVDARGVLPDFERTSSTGDGDKRNSSPGRARRKPLKPLRREGRVSGVPVVTTVCLLPLHTGRGCPRAPGFSCALTLKARNSFHHSDAPRREMAELCLVERLIKYPCASPAPAGPRAGASRRAQRETPAKLRRG